MYLCDPNAHHGVYRDGCHDGCHGDRDDGHDDGHGDDQVLGTIHWMCSVKNRF